MELLLNQNCNLNIGNKQSKLRCLRNGVPRDRSWLFLKIYIYDLFSQSLKSLPLLQSGIVILFWKLEELKKDFKSRYDCFLFLSLDMNNKTLSLKDKDGSLSFNKREAELELKVYNTMNFYHYVRSNLSLGKTGKIAHVLSGLFDS